MSSEEKPKHVKYELIFGTHTWALVGAADFLLVLAVLYIVYGTMGSSGLRGLYSTIFGYTILISIHIGHYWVFLTRKDNHGLYFLSPASGDAFHSSVATWFLLRPMRDICGHSYFLDPRKAIQCLRRVGR